MKIYRITQKVPQTYLDIGHHGYDVPPENQQAWILHNDDILTGTKYQGHGDFVGRDIPLSISIGGRIDHVQKRISIYNGYHEGVDYSEDSQVQYAISLLKMDYPDYKIYYCFSGSTPRRLAQSNYYDIGHGRDSSVWALKENGDVVYGHAKDGVFDHEELRVMYPGLKTLIAGRISHVSKKISVSWSSRVDYESVKHAISILQMDYPGYKIQEMPPKFAKTEN